MIDMLVEQYKHSHITSTNSNNINTSIKAQNSSCQSNKCSPDADCIVINNETICLCPTHLIGNGHECYPGPSDSTVPVNSDATLTSMVETAMLALLQPEPVQQVRQLQPDIRPLHEQLDNVCQKEPAGFDKGHVDCDYDEGVCKLTCNDGYKLALCKANGVSKCNCKGASCLWTTLGRNCRCKSTTVQTPSRFIEQGTVVVFIYLGTAYGKTLTLGHKFYYNHLLYF